MFAYSSSFTPSIPGWFQFNGLYEMERLATVSVQLIMQFTATSTHLKFARCCRQLLLAGSTAPAWLHSTSLRVTIESLARSSIPLCPSSLLHHAMCDLSVTRPRSQLPYEAIAAVLVRLSHLPRIRSLILECAIVTRMQSEQLLQQANVRPWIQRLELVWHADRDNQRLVGLIARLRSLRTLILRVDCSIEPDDAVAGSWREVASLPSLTALRLQAYHPHKLSNTLMLAFKACADRGQLLRLQVDDFFGLEPHQAVCNVLPHLSQLRHLTLNFFQPQSAEVFSQRSLYARVFAALLHLSSLHLCDVWDCHILLPLLVHFPSLRHLALSVNRTNVFPGDFGSAAIFGPLLDVLTELQVTILPPELGHDNGTTASCHRFPNEAEILGLPQGHRIHVLARHNSRLPAELLFDAGTNGFAL
jgi:hypothetical protein